MRKLCDQASSGRSGCSNFTEEAPAPDDRRDWRGHCDERGLAAPGVPQVVLWPCMLKLAVSRRAGARWGVKPPSSRTVAVIAEAHGFNPRAGDPAPPRGARRRADPESADPERERAKIDPRLHAHRRGKDGHAVGYWSVVETGARATGPSTRSPSPGQSSSSGTRVGTPARASFLRDSVSSAITPPPVTWSCTSTCVVPLGSSTDGRPGGLRVPRSSRCRRRRGCRTRRTRRTPPVDARRRRRQAHPFAAVWQMLTRPADQRSLPVPGARGGPRHVPPRAVASAAVHSAWRRMAASA